MEGQNLFLSKRLRLLMISSKKTDKTKLIIAKIYYMFV